MTLPTGTISISNLNTEVGAAATTARGLDWLGGNVKGATVYNLGAVKGLTWLQRNNVAANCTANMAGQCNCQVNCGTVQGNPSGFNGGTANYGGTPVAGFTNCTANAACNCNCNCDNRAWLQANCNCAAANGYNNCAYNCNYNNCNCNCACDCVCRC
jgi:hypothetical protein